MRSGAIPARMAGTSGARPFRGGSTQITWGRMPSRASWAAVCPASPQRKRTLSTPFRAALALASSMAWGTISAPMTWAARWASAREIVPMPQ